MISVLPYIIIFIVWMGASNLLIRKKDYEHILIRGVFYALWIGTIVMALYHTIPSGEIQRVMQPRTEIVYRGRFIVFIVLNTRGYKQAMRFSITRKSSSIPSMFLAPRKYFVYTKYMEICFQQACFVWIIMWIHTSITSDVGHIASIMAGIMMIAHIPMYRFINRKDATIITIGATVGGRIGTVVFLWNYNGLLRTLAIHIGFYSVVLALLGKYHRELHMLKKDIVDNKNW